MFWRSINETLDKSKTIAGSIEGDFWLVFERVFVEPRPSLVDIGKIGGNDVEFLILESAGFEEIGFDPTYAFNMFLFGIILGAGERFCRDVRGGKLDVLVF